MRILRRPLDLGLVTLFVVSVAMVLLSHEDFFVRDLMCAHMRCPELSHAKAWQKIIYDLAIGSVISLLFYSLVVRLPEHGRRQRIKRSFRGRYRQFKEGCIAVILGLADGSYFAGLPEQLVDQEKFRTYFKEGDRWNTFLNALDEGSLRELKALLEIFRDEVVFVLSSTDIRDEEPFEFLKRLSAVIRSMQDTTPDYDDVKSFSHFLWEMFAGWDFSTGYRKQDVVEEMIASI